ncbi:MAG TPA: ABC transporter ATP-binding protein [Myxococcaceae bacterium]|nr:ABC transporter ATP-binding protein [Myxococcaceae bacterium]
MSAAAIELVEVVKRFSSGVIAVDKVTLAVRPGECFGLIGPNGAGKTTTFSMLCGFLHPTAGRLRVLDADPSRPGALKRRVGVLPQDAALPPWARVGELLVYWARLSALERPEHEARTALEKVDLASAWSTRAAALSHGMGKRIAMAQALMGDPPVVLLDEPTAGLDPKIAAQVRELIRQMKARQTVVVSSHNLHELEELCDSAAILDRGKLVQAGTMAELTRRTGEFRVQIARGTVPTFEVERIAGVKAARYEPAASALLVTFDGEGHPPEEIVTATLEVLIRHGVRVLGVSIGRKLEERVLQLT